MGLQEVRSGDDRQLQEIADVLAGSHKILLITGAGISTSCGIPDFRSKDGLYNMIPDQNVLPSPPPSEPSTPSLKRVMSFSDESLASSQSSTSSANSRRSSASPSSKLRGQDLFDSRVFQNAASTTMFYQFIASLRQTIRDEVRSTSSVHKFVRVLRDGGRLMRCYTQNIDGLECREGLVTDLARGKGNKRRFMKKHFEAPRPAHTPGTDFDGGCEVVQLHGDLANLRCTMCATQFEWTDEETDIYLQGAAPGCPKCKAKSEQRRASGKRGLATGALRPNIVLYGEDHPSNTLLTPLIPFDAGCQPEVMVIMGTSLKVFGLQKIVREFAKAVHARKNGKGKVIFVNRTRPAESVWDGIIDSFVAMDCDDWVDDLKTRRPDLWLRQGDIGLTVTKSTQPSKRKRKSADGDETVGEKRVKRAKVVVEVPKVAVTNTSPPAIPSTPSKKQTNSDRRYKVPLDYPGRAILSPLAQARRPTVSPLSSPVRMDDEHGAPEPMRRSTPRRPTVSPFTPGVLSGSKLRIQTKNNDEEEAEGGFAATSRNKSALQGHEADHSSRGKDRNTWGGGSKDEPTESGFVTRILQRVRGRQWISKPWTQSAEEQTDEQIFEVDTPSRGPRGRKINVFPE
ncbi:NAD-dependent histone deacetylase HST3 [Exophiala dermatitidis]